MDVFGVIWLAVGIFFLVAEILTVNFGTIFFSVGGFAAFIVDVLGGNIYIETIVFLVVSIGLIILVRPIAIRRLKRVSPKMNLDIAVGKEALVIEDISLHKWGACKLDGKIWTSFTLDDVVYKEGEIVRVVDIEGVKLRVTKKEEI